MPVVSTISIKLDAQTAAISKGFKQVQAESVKLRTSLRQSLGAGILKFNTALGVLKTALGAVGSAFASVQQALEKVAAIGDFADRIQISTQRLQELQNVTEQFGGEAGVLNTALQRMQRRIADAAISGGPLADRITEMGESVADLAKLSPDEQFLRMADAISSLGTRGEQTAAVMALMDTEGVALVETLNQGSEALRRQMAVMGEHLNLTDREIRAAQEHAAQLKIVQRQWEKTTTELKMNVIPVLQTLTEELNNIAEGYKFIQESSKWLFGVGQGGEHQTMPGFEERQAARMDSRKVLGDLGRAWKGYEKDVAAVAKNVIPAIAAMMPSAAPKIGAVTSTSAAGFSALQEGRRRAMERARWEKEALAVLKAIEDYTRETAEGESFVPVSIT